MVNCKACGLSKSSITSRENISFHKFPQDPIRRKQWVDFVGDPEWIPVKQSFLCSRHFTQECFDETSILKPNRLHYKAIPTIQIDRKEKYLSTAKHLLSPSCQENLPSTSHDVSPERSLVLDIDQDTLTKRLLKRRIVDLTDKLEVKKSRIIQLNKKLSYQRKRIHKLNSLLSELRQKKLLF